MNEEFPGQNKTPESDKEILDEEDLYSEQEMEDLDNKTPEQEPSAIDEESSEQSESESTYLELKREYKDKKRAYEDALAQDVENRSGLKKMFGLGRKNLSPEIQSLYDESLVAEKEYYQSFVETQKGRVEERLNKYNQSEEAVSVVPSLVKRHVTNSAEERFEVQKRELPPRLQSLLAKVKANKYAMGALATAGLGMKGLSVLSSFGVGLAAGAGTRWTMNKVIEGQEKRLAEKTGTFNNLIESGEWDDLADIKNEYFQDLRKIDNRKLQANLTAVGVAVTAGTSAHDYFEGAIPADADGMLGDKAGEYAETAGEKAGGYWENVKETVGDWFGGDEPVQDSETPSETEARPAEAPDEETTLSQEQEEKERKHAEALQILEDRREAFDARIAEQIAQDTEAFELAKRMGVDIKDPLEYRMEGGVITEVEGKSVPEEYFSEADKANIETARMIREGVSGGSWDDGLDPAEESTGETTQKPLETPAAESATVVTDEVVSEEVESRTQAEAKVDALNRLEEIKAEVAKIANAEVAGATIPSPEEFTHPTYEVKSGDTLSQILADTMKARIETGEFTLPAGVDENNLVKHLYTTFPEFIDANSSEALLSADDWKELGISSGDPNLIYPGEELDMNALLSKVGEVNIEATDTAPESVTDAGDVVPGAPEASTETPTASEVVGSETSGTTTADNAETVDSETQDTIQPVEQPTTPEPTAEVPNYAGTESTPEEVVSEEQIGQQEIVEENPPESFSNIPRETSAEEIAERRDALESQLQTLVAQSGPSVSLESLNNIDGTLGYEPLYTSDFSEKSVEMTSNLNSEQFANVVITEIVNAYRDGQIDLPAQMAYLADMIEDRRASGGVDIFENVGSMGIENATAIVDQFGEDYVLAEFSSEQLKEVGISSGSLDNVNEGDNVQIGQIIKKMMQSMAERINA